MAKTYLRAASVRSQSFDPETKTVEIVWTTGASVARYDWRDGTEFNEVLSLEPGAVRLERLNNGAPFLNTHASWTLADVIGSVVPGSARIEGGKGIATVKLSGAAADADTIGKIRDGVIRNISVGYLVHAFSESEKDGVTTRTVTDWEPLEISAVPIPADAGAQIRSHGGRRRAAPAPKVSRRVADIRRMARKVGLPKFGSKHVRLGTTSDDFFLLLAERLAAPKLEERQMAKNDRVRGDYDRGQREAERLLGRSKRDDEESKPAASKEDDDDDAETCPTCGQTIDDRDDDDDDGAKDRDDDADEDRDDAADGDDEDKKSSDDKRKRGVTFGGRRVRTAPTRTEAPSSRSLQRQAAPHHGKIERSEMDRGAAAARKLLGKR